MREYLKKVPGVRALVQAGRSAVSVTKLGLWRGLARAGLPRPIPFEVHGIEVPAHPKVIRDFRFFTERDPDMIEEMRSFIDLTRDAKCLIDVGAAAGIFSLVFTSRRGASAISFEPYRKVFWLLRYHARGRAISPVRLALGREASTTHMKEEGGHLVASLEGSAVPVVSLDSYLEDRGIVPNVIKIDVEGYELEVLQGAEGALRKYRPTVFLELHPQHLRDRGLKTDEVIRPLADAGYEVPRFDPGKRAVRIIMTPRGDTPYSHVVDGHA